MPCPRMSPVPASVTSLDEEFFWEEFYDESGSRLAKTRKCSDLEGFTIEDLQKKLSMHWFKS